MNCRSVRALIESGIERLGSPDERLAVAHHLHECSECSEHCELASRAKSPVRRLPQLEAPSYLKVQLRVDASRERQRRMIADLPVHVRLAARMRLFIDNLMRPLALPFAGGLVSALFLFGVIVPTLGPPQRPYQDVPTVLSTEASANLSMAPIGVLNDVVFVEMIVDSQGRMVDYSVPKDVTDRESLRAISNVVLFTQFSPATYFGEPRTAKVLVAIRRSSRIDVKG